MSSVELMAVDDLRPTEWIKKRRAARLAHTIESSGIWRCPICIEAESLFVMDGHHRLEVAKMLGLLRVPVLRLSYNDIPVISRKSGFNVTPDQLRERAAKGLLYPYKTTRHLFPAGLVACQVPITLLRQPADTIRQAA
ncbi:ParB N-terminal domain-containing protein [Aestuariispira insulae]|uniref:ParB-like nuclease family protein n=1 Tax=Aestuariispira insulae TaxID=1461337 RepID=A0A3D9H5T6_9PROT|nr:ParB N-terminal domain-containing protein [Aestuariispira insulae]RED44844.1 ParB-like nuclease family protein [Aestuariispira insulae]